MYDKKATSSPYMLKCTHVNFIRHTYMPQINYTGIHQRTRPEHLVELRVALTPVALLHSSRLHLLLNNLLPDKSRDVNQLYTACQSPKLFNSNANMKHPLLLVNLLLCGTSHGQRPFINIFDEFLHQLDVFNLLDSPRPAPTLRPLRPVARPPARPRQPSAPRKPKKLEQGRQVPHIRSKLPPILNHGDGAASDAWVRLRIEVDS